MPSPLNYVPADIRCARDYEAVATRFIAAPTYAYIAGGSGDDITARANMDAFAALSITPRILRDVTGGHTRLKLAGRDMEHPILLAPVALQRLVHPLGEIETARAAAATDTCMVCSAQASRTLEDVSKAGGPNHWFQLYLQSERDATLDLVKRAEAAGYGALVLTVDAAVQVPSRQALRAGFVMPADCIPANLPNGTPQPPDPSGPRAGDFFRGPMRHAPVWTDIDWLLRTTTLPLWIKGVLHAADAQELERRGVTGIIVSNHGGRALDGVPASLTALKAVRSIVGATFPVLLDGGIRSGSDVFKALACGADAILIGRLQLYALSVAGALGVAHMTRLLKEELEICMALAGCATLADVRHAQIKPYP